MESLRPPVEQQSRSEITEGRDPFSQGWDGELGGRVEGEATEEVEEREEEEGEEEEEEWEGHLEKELLRERGPGV